MHWRIQGAPPTRPNSFNFTYPSDIGMDVVNQAYLCDKTYYLNLYPDVVNQKRTEYHTITIVTSVGRTVTTTYCHGNIITSVMFHLLRWHWVVSEISIADF